MMKQTFVVLLVCVVIVAVCVQAREEHEAQASIGEHSHARFVRRLWNWLFKARGKEPADKDPEVKQAVKDAEKNGASKEEAKQVLKPKLFKFNPADVPKQHRDSFEKKSYCKGVQNAHPLADKILGYREIGACLKTAKTASDSSHIQRKYENELAACDKFMLSASLHIDPKNTCKSNVKKMRALFSKVRDSVRDVQSASGYKQRDAKKKFDEHVDNLASTTLLDADPKCMAQGAYYINNGHNGKKLEIPPAVKKIPSDCRLI